MKTVKQSGLALFTALALMASIGAASAAASGFVANGDPYGAVITGASSGGLVITASGQNTGCTDSEISSEMKEASASISTSMKGGVCGSTPINYAGCGLVLHPGAETSPGNFAGTYDIGPAGCGPITTKTTLGCPLSIYPSTGVSATFTNTGSGSSAKVKVVTSGSGITYTAASPCSGVKQSNGSLQGTWTASATRAGAAVGLAVQKAIPAALEIGGSEASPEFESSHYPVTIAGTSAKNAAPLANFLFGNKVTCASAQFSSGLSSSSAELAVGVTYPQGCNYITGPVSVLANGCKYVYSIVPFSLTGDAELSCPGSAVVQMLMFTTKAKQEELKWICKIEIGPQDLDGGAEFSGGGAHFGIGASFTGIDYTLTRLSWICPGSGGGGSYSDGTYADEIDLTGSF